jgi:hypothetical protein
MCFTYRFTLEAGGIRSPKRRKHLSTPHHFSEGSSYVL